jgi:hypothetical protein
LCASCKIGAGQRQSKGKAKHTQLPKSKGGSGQIKAGDCTPGQRVSIDHYDSHVKGRLWGSYGRSRPEQMYCGGTIFVDHASGLIHVEHQVSLSAMDTLVAKKSFERMALNNGVAIQRYHGDNGAAFTSHDFTRHIIDMKQGLSFSGVGAHHQNGVAERTIRTVVTRARVMMLHAAMRWPEVVDASLWPMALSHATYLWNITPRRESGLAPLEIFSGSKFQYPVVQKQHVWGCPTYVLDPRLQDGKKIPKWQPRSCRGMFLGYSKHHATNVGCVLNMKTKSITPQFHVVYDDWFSTIAADEPTPPPNWADLIESASEHVLGDPDRAPELHEEWMDAAELVKHQERLKMRSASKRAQIDLDKARGDLEIQRRVEERKDHTDGNEKPEIQRRVGVRQVQGEGIGGNRLNAEFDLESEIPEQASEGAMPETIMTPVIEESPAVDAQRQMQLVRERRQPERLIMKHGGKRYESSRSFLAQMEKIENLLVDPVSNFVDGLHPLSYVVKKYDEDTPNYQMAMSGTDKEGYLTAMEAEVKALEGQNTWQLIERQKLPKGANVLPSTWVFKRKRYPDGRVRKLKACFCVRGDMQLEGVDYFDTYAPVVSWMAVRLMFTLSIVLNLATKQVDYTNAFVQAELKEEVFVECPKNFAQTNDDRDLVLKLKKSLYGLRQAPLAWFEKLKDGLVRRGFNQSKLEPCLFVHGETGVICLVYVDDCLFFAKDAGDIDRMIKNLSQEFKLEPEADVTAFLGIEFRKHKTGALELLQPHLIDRVIDTVFGKEEFHPKATPTNEKPLGQDEHGEECIERWDYASVVGMLMYLSSNSRPDIAFAVHQCARYSFNPKRSHEEALKRIVQYLKGTKDKGLNFTPNGKFLIDCYVDADYAGLWRYEDDQDPVSVKSRTGYILIFAGCPLLWVSKLQTEVALSTLEAEYIALSQSMRDLIPARRLIEEILPPFGIKLENTKTHSTVFEDNEGAIGLANSPKITPRTKHIGIKYHFFREHVREGNIGIQHVSSENQVADVFTKGLTMVKFERLRRKLLGW